MGQRIRSRTLEMLMGIYERFGTAPFVYVAVRDLVPAPRNVVQLADLGVVEAVDDFHGTTVWAVTGRGKETIIRQKERWATAVTA